MQSMHQTHTNSPGGSQLHANAHPHSWAQLGGFSRAQLIPGVTRFCDSQHCDSRELILHVLKQHLARIGQYALAPENACRREATICSHTVKHVQQYCLCSRARWAQLASCIEAGAPSAVQQSDAACRMYTQNQHGCPVPSCVCVENLYSHAGAHQGGLVTSSPFNRSCGSCQVTVAPSLANQAVLVPACCPLMEFPRAAASHLALPEKWSCIQHEGSQPCRKQSWQLGKVHSNPEHCRCKSCSKQWGSADT